MHEVARERERAEGLGERERARENFRIGKFFGKFSEIVVVSHVRMLQNGLV